MRNKAKDLSKQVEEKDAEISRLREKTSEKAQDAMKGELRKAYDVLRHLKKKVGSHAFNEEYAMVMSELREALQIPAVPVRAKKRRPAKKKATA